MADINQLMARHGNATKRRTAHERACKEADKALGAANRLVKEIEPEMATLAEASRIVPTAPAPVSGILRDLAEWRERKAEAEEVIARIEGKLAAADEDRCATVAHLLLVFTSVADPHLTAMTLVRELRAKGYELTKRKR